MFHICHRVPDRPAKFWLNLRTFDQIYTFRAFYYELRASFFFLARWGKNVVVQFDTAVSLNKAGNVHLNVKLWRVRVAIFSRGEAISVI